MQPLPGDYDGDGRADVAAFDPAKGTTANPSMYDILYAQGGGVELPWGNTTIRPARETISATAVWTLPDMIHRRPRRRSISPSFTAPRA